MHTMISRRTVATLGLAALGVGATSCSDREASSGSSPQTLTVFAAASLAKVLEPIDRDFEKAHAGVKIAVTTAGSNDLVTQLAQGAPGDVLATADLRTMESARKKNLLDGEPAVFATNELVIAVAPGNPHRITALKDLAASDLSVVRCAPQVPCGAVTDALLKKDGTILKPRSEAASVTDVLGAVTSGEADAGLVYTTDIARSGGKAEAVTIAGAESQRTKYPAAVVHGSSHAELARAYVQHLRSAEARKHLAAAGFGAP